jgi:hypothetical protein
MLCGACAGPTALRGGRPRQRRWPPTARRWCGRGRSVASTTSPRGGGRSTAGSSSTSSRSAGRSRRASRPRTTRCLLSPSRCDGPTVLSWLLVCDSSPAARLLWPSYRGDCGCAASAGHLSLSLPLSLCVCVLCACRCVNLCALHLAGRCQAPFLAWIGSPCLRDCVHGASITCRTYPPRACPPLCPLCPQRKYLVSAVRGHDTPPLYGVLGWWLREGELYPLDDDDGGGEEQQQPVSSRRVQQQQQQQQQSSSSGCVYSCPLLIDRIRVRVEIMGPVKYENVGKSQPVLMMINPMIFTRTRMWRPPAVPEAS